MSKIFVFAASKSEADPLARLVGVSRWDTPNHAGRIATGPNQLEFFISGIGPKQATDRAVRILFRGRGPHLEGEQRGESADVAIVIGLCGSLTDSLAQSTIVMYSSCLSAMNGGTSCTCTPELSERVTALLNGKRRPRAFRGLRFFRREHGEDPQTCKRRRSALRSIPRAVFSADRFGPPCAPARNRRAWPPLPAARARRRASADRRCQQ